MTKKQVLFYGALIFLLWSFTSSDLPILRNNSGNITLECKSDFGNISATNHKVKSAYDINSGRIQFSVLVNDLYFEKAIIQEEFNSQIMKSNQFPLATFNGKINNNSLINLTRNGTYSSSISGDLTLKGITKRVTTTGSFIVENSKIQGVATFYAKPEDFNIAIPDYLRNQVSDKIKINVQIEFKKPE